MNRQPGKALPYFLKLREPTVFNLIREHNLFTDVQDQALLLIEFDQELQKHREQAAAGNCGTSEAKTHKRDDSQHGNAVDLLVDHTHSIPVGLLRRTRRETRVEPSRPPSQIPRVIAQLQDHRHYLYLYLDALFDKDPHLAFDYSDLQVDLYAEYNAAKLMDFLRASNYYSLERVSVSWPVATPKSRKGSLTNASSSQGVQNLRLSRSRSRDGLLARPDG